MHHELIESIRKNAEVITVSSRNYHSIMEMAKDSRIVLIGAATHGTKEFYHERSEITRRLIIEQNFDAVVIEGDFPDAYNINRYVNTNNDSRAETVLETFERFPTWIWQNTEILQFIKWLRAYNNYNNSKPGIKFYGLDLYSMNTSINAVISYLKKVDPGAAKLAAERYSCLDSFIERPQMYAYAKYKTLIEDCQEKIIQQLVDLKKNAFEYIKKRDGRAEDELFYAEQNARLVKDAEEYYHSLYSGDRSSWNLRDMHMGNTLDSIINHLNEKLWKPAKIIVWAHNSHVGDASATEMAKRHEINLGQLVRQKYGNKALLIGFSTYQGTVTAASNWGSKVETKTLLPALPGSHADIFHNTGIGNFILNLRNKNEAVTNLNIPLLQRFIGVIYHPKTEMMSHYYHSILPKQFDVIIHIDTTSAVEPLDTTAKIHADDVAETYPYGL